MTDDSFGTTHLHALQARIRNGDRAAQDELIKHTTGRLERLARKMLRHYPGVARWVEPSDVLQNASLRLLRALREVRPDSVAGFFSLAAEQIRRELLDLARHYYGPLGLGAHHAGNGADGSGAPPFNPPGKTVQPADLLEWQEFHEQVAR